MFFGRVEQFEKSNFRKFRRTILSQHGPQEGPKRPPKSIKKLQKIGFLSDSLLGCLRDPKNPEGPEGFQKNASKFMLFRKAQKCQKSNFAKLKDAILAQHADFEVPRLRAAARSCQELRGAARSCQELQGAARSCQELPGAARSCEELPGVARSC